MHKLSQVPTVPKLFIYFSSKTCLCLCSQYMPQVDEKGVDVFRATSVERLFILIMGAWLCVVVCMILGVDFNKLLYVDECEVLYSGWLQSQVWSIIKTMSMFTPLFIFFGVSCCSKWAILLERLFKEMRTRSAHSGVSNHRRGNYYPLVIMFCRESLETKDVCLRGPTL